jgi:hypothetical protein
LRTDYSTEPIFIAVLAVLAVSVWLNVRGRKSSTLTQQAECAKQAAQVVQGLRDRWGDERSSVTFTSHYNEKLDKCFVRVESYQPETHTGFNSVDVLDAFLGTEYGEFEPNPGPQIYPVPCC